MFVDKPFFICQLCHQIKLFSVMII